jgi:hypothetical protein
VAAAEHGKQQQQLAAEAAAVAQVVHKMQMVCKAPTEPVAVVAVADVLIQIAYQVAVVLELF